MADRAFSKIVLHWTAGGNKATPTDIRAYHFIVEGNGNVVKGSHNVWNNSKFNMDRINRRTGNYAMHTGGGNTGAIGVSMAGMAGFSGTPGSTKYPITKVQFEATIKLLAKLCNDYKISPDEIWTHYEFGLKNPKSTSAGKIDIIYLPPYPDKSKGAIGNFIRNQVRQVLGQSYKMDSRPVEVTEEDRAAAVKVSSATSGGQATSDATTTERERKTVAEAMEAASEEASKLIKDPEVDDGTLFGNFRDTSGKPLGWLRSTNNWLERLPKVVTKSLNNMVGRGENAVQSRVDMICTWLAYKVNVAIEEKRQDFIRAAYAQYTSNARGPVWSTAFAIQSFFEDPLGAVGGFASSIWKPVKNVFEYTKALLKEVPRFAANLANVVSSLPPTPPSPHINFDKFKLKVNSISMKEIIKGPAGLKDPEDMFPKPIDPYRQDNFILFGDDAVDLIDEGLQKKKYNLKTEDFESMNSSIQKAAGADLPTDLGIGSTYSSLPSFDGEKGSFDNNSIIDNSMG